ncbi:MAG: KUP/HAK/KT family potassium transporter [Candidatus Eremiobacteraeota bacterium]|nr:KUP/HAK/KT family potassium transporter [Candidatus Eremiobacteraeota bacterium]
MKRSSRDSTAVLAVAAIGVVFGDIGTSPLYTLKTCYTTAAAAPTLENTLGIISLLAWALIVVVCIKYVTILMRVDHEGEGGILALLAIASPPRLLGAPRHARWLVLVVVIGAAMLVGDGMITPAISVISAVEGIGVATSAAAPYIVPISAGVLLALFAIQFRGTQRVGAAFGPIMILWFIAIAVSGATAIAHRPQILAAINPIHALYFVVHHGWYGFLILGAVILCLTGAEALYADLSHFGRLPITRAWYAVVFPALMLNYFGQGANVIGNPRALDSPFYALTGGWTLIPMVVLATAATVIASQSLISAAFTLAEQAIAMNLSPRFVVRHTSAEHRGQVYAPFVNVVLAVICLLLVLTFRSSDRLASAYGLAVACTMLATTVTYCTVAVTVFKWSKRVVLSSMAIFLVIDATFVLAGIPKFFDGAWVPIAISAVVATISLTWLRGRRALAFALAEDQVPIARYLEHYDRAAQTRGHAILLTREPSGVPFVRRHPWMAPLLADKKIVLLMLAPAARPYVEDAKRVTIDTVDPALTIVRAHFGYMEQPHIARVLHACHRLHVHLQEGDSAFFFAVPAIVRKPHGGIRSWQRGLFAWLQAVSRPLIEDLEIPPAQRVGIGVEVPL